MEGKSGTKKQEHDELLKSIHRLITQKDR